MLRSARPLAGTLTVSGLSARTRALLDRAARRAGRHVLAAPAGPLGGFPAQPLVPGASVAAMLSTGDVGVGAVGTVTYRDGSRILAFGHPLDALGQRSLFLEDAYVFSVIANPLGIPDLGADSYKLTSAGGHTQGTLTTDSLNSISGSLGAAPRPPSHSRSRPASAAAGPSRSTPTWPTSAGSGTAPTSRWSRRSAHRRAWTT